MSVYVRPELIDDLIDSYVDWQEECLFLEDAYDLWASGPAEDRGLAFAAYSAALDREQQASTVHADRANRVAREVASRPGPLRRLSQLAATESREHAKGAR